MLGVCAHVVNPFLIHHVLESSIQRRKPRVPLKTGGAVQTQQQTLRCRQIERATKGRAMVKFQSALCEPKAVLAHGGRGACSARRSTSWPTTSRRSPSWVESCNMPSQSIFTVGKQCYSRHSWCESNGTVACNCGAAYPKRKDLAHPKEWVCNEPPAISPSQGTVVRT